jgi:hypothetical protein
MLFIAAGVAAVMSGRSEAQTTSLPEIIVRPSVPKTPEQNDFIGGPNGKGGADKEGETRRLERLNQQLKRKVDETNSAASTPPLDARSPDTKTGVVNIPGVQQQYGKNFGISVIPYRPGPPVYAPPLGPR